MSERELRRITSLKGIFPDLSKPCDEDGFPTDWERDLETKLIQEDPRPETEQEIATRLAEESVGYCE